MSVRRPVAGLCVLAAVVAVGVAVAFAVAPPATGVVGEVVLSGGPGGGSQLQGQGVGLIISTGGHAVLSKAVPSSTIVKVPLSPGTYAVSAMDGNADCETSSIQVKTGAFSSFKVVCSLR
jgi:hypothetical protein